MFERAKEIVDIVSKETDSVILFHSLSGKDSICLLDLLYPKFKRIVCVFMYIVPNLEHLNVYYRYAKNKYPNVEFIQVPHYAYYNYVKIGYMGIKQNPDQRQWTLSDIAEKVKEKTGIEWVCCGFKQSDSLNRRVMLRSWRGVTGQDKDGNDREGLEAIYWKTKKFYPLSTYKNGDVLNYIQANGLKTPEKYSEGGQSCGTAIQDPSYQMYLKLNYPEDLEKIYSVFPMARVVLMDNRYEEYTRPEDLKAK